MQRERYSATLHDWAGWHARQQSGRFRRTAFQHPAFLASFYREKPGHCEEIVVSLFDHRLQRVVMALPLVMHRQAGLRRIEAADLGLADYVAPLVAEDLSDDPAEADAMWAAILKALPQADVVSFKKMPPEIRPGTPNPLAGRPRGGGPTAESCRRISPHEATRRASSASRRDGPAHSCAGIAWAR